MSVQSHHLAEVSYWISEGLLVKRQGGYWFESNPPQLGWVGFGWDDQNEICPSFVNAMARLRACGFVMAGGEGHALLAQ